jgi:hypothetical protein
MWESMLMQHAWDDEAFLSSEEGCESDQVSFAIDDDHFVDSYFEGR